MGNEMNDEQTIEAIYLYLLRKFSIQCPSGYTDNGGRWFPNDDEKQSCCDNIRYPSRAYPWSLYKHCFSSTHVANLTRVSKSTLLGYKLYLPLLIGRNPDLDREIELILRKG